MPSPALWAISGEETDLKIMLNTPANIHYIRSHLTAFLIFLKLLRSVDGLKELSISPSSSTRVVSIHFSGQFPGVLSKFPSKEDHFNFHQSQFFSFLTWSAEKGFAWTFPSFSKRWASVHFHGSASHNLTSSDKFSLLLTPHYPHHPSSNCQFRFIYTKLSAGTISRSLNLWEGLGSASAVACVFKLLTRVQPCFFVLPVLGFDSRQYHERWLSEDESVGGSLGIILIEIFHLECLKTGNCNNDRHGTQLLLIKGFGWSRYIFIWYRTLLQSSQIKKSDGK